jgi:hypothetical protein
MTDDTKRDDEPAPETPVEGAEYSEADLAEAEEAEAAAAEEYFEEAEDFFDEETLTAQREEAMADAQVANLRAQADWFLVHKELLTLLLANCLFLAGVLVSWGRLMPWDPGFDANQGRSYLTGLDTIRGGLIFALALHGFWTLFLNFRYRQTVVWPFLINAIFALWVGIPGFTSNFGSDRWTAATEYMDGQTASFLAKGMAPLSNTAPGFWLLTAGGALVLIVLLKGVISGAGKAKAKAAQQGSRRRR